MQVWSQRKRLAEDAIPASPVDGAGRAVTEVWALRVLGGVHAGAERKLPDRTLLMIGSSDDCDIIFSDQGVAPHHCIVSRDGTDVFIRSVDSQIRVDDQFVYPGDPRPLAPFSLVRIGGTCFAMGPHWSDRWQALLEQMQPVARTDDSGPDLVTPRRHGRLVSLGVAAALVIASGVALFLAQRNTRAHPLPVLSVAHDVLARQTVETLGYAGVRVKAGPGDIPQLSGYVERAQDVTKLRTELAKKNVRANVEVKDGTQIAADITESMRMADMHGVAKWQGRGAVLIEGHFGDGAKIKPFLASRTMTDFNINLDLKANVRNLDPPIVTIADIPDGKRIMKIVDGDDPYLVTADDSQIYQGGKMPTGETFYGIENNEVLIRDETGNTRRLSRNSVIDASFQ